MLQLAVQMFAKLEEQPRACHAASKESAEVDLTSPPQPVPHETALVGGARLSGESSRVRPAGEALPYSFLRRAHSIFVDALEASEKDLEFQRLKQASELAVKRRQQLDASEDALLRKADAALGRGEGHAAAEQTDRKLEEELWEVCAAAGMRALL